jgi:hypothetical protein
MISVVHGRILATLRAATPLVLVAAVVAVLVRFPPGRSSFYPVCPVYFIFHLQCPGCGGTRALAALLHRHLYEALHWNALITLTLPLGAGYGSSLYWRFLQRKVLRGPQVAPAAIYAALIVAAVFTIERNLPVRWRQPNAKRPRRAGASVMRSGIAGCGFMLRR